MSAWTYASNDEVAVFFHKSAGTILELSAGSNGWFVFIANPTAESQICWSSTDVADHDLSSDESIDLIQRLRDNRGSPLNFVFRLGNWSGHTAAARREMYSHVLMVLNSEDEDAEISSKPSKFHSDET